MECASHRLIQINTIQSQHSDKGTSNSMSPAVKENISVHLKTSKLRIKDDASFDMEIFSFVRSILETIHHVRFRAILIASSTVNDIETIPQRAIVFDYLHIKGWSNCISYAFLFGS